MSRVPDEKQSLIPLVVMICFTVLLVAALFYRVYQADRDLGMMRVAERQARLAAESGINYAIERMRSAVSSSDRAADPTVLSSLFFSENIESTSWTQFGQKSRAFFRIISIRKLSDVNKTKTGMLDEDLQYQVIAEGRCGNYRYSSAAVVQFYDLVKTFAVFSSLDEFYYGTPIQPWVERSGSLELFVDANAELFDSGRLSRFGICYDPILLHQMYQPEGEDPFNPAPGNRKMAGNYGRIYMRGGESPCFGPLYCDGSVVVDSHTFFGPVQTAQYFYRRGASQPRVSMGNTAVAMNSSLRIQHAVDSLEGRNPNDVLIDRDSENYRSYIPQWRPDFSALREISRARGIYIDAEGKGFINDAPVDVDFHPGEELLYSDSYHGPNSVTLEQDVFKKKFIVLSSDNNFDGYNNISGANLRGARILFSERSIYLRGDIGTDLVVVTPGHIFITGPTNFDSNMSLFLIAGEGTALSTVDLERYIKENSANEEFIEAAREWLIRAAIYKPGAGVYTSTSRPQKGAPLNFRRLFSGRSLKIHVQGACIGGNLQRWIDNSEENSLRITHNPQAVERLNIRPVSINLLRQRTRPDR
ncbi:MAG: hypothetical protein KKB51_18810 [Candidatus Riflebacteria bacterium]|nr:hypothetical protein [Candidatus Riflebacteria bacterium]